MKRFWYTILFYLCLPLILVRLIFRTWHVANNIKNIKERIGSYAHLKTLKNSIWIHAASVGETISLIPVIKHLRCAYPETPIVITTVTVTGKNRATALFAQNATLCFCPYDLPNFVESFIKHFRPRILIIMETELWPNIITNCFNKNIPIVIANGRLSENSMNKYKLIDFLVRPMVEKITLVCAQSPEDGARFYQLGLNKNRLTICGNIKFDMELEKNSISEGKKLREMWLKKRDANTKIWIVASTHRGEEVILIQAFKQVRLRFPNLILLIVPRHPNRFKEVGKCIHAENINYVKRSDNLALGTCDHVILGDSMGEMHKYYAASNIAFVGGSLVSVGGHNMLEPALLGLPIMVGPQLFNFQQISQKLHNAGALLKVQNTEEIVTQLSLLLESSDTCQHMGEAAQKVVQANQGAIARLMRAIDCYMRDS